MPCSIFIVAAVVAAVAQGSSLPELPSFLSNTSQSVFPPLKDIAVEIFNYPELGLNEYYAHQLVVDYFDQVEGWEVTPHAYGMDTAYTLEFEHRPQGYDGALKSIGFLSEYDALIVGSDPLVGHGCGHNHIVLNGIAAATLASRALVEYNVPGRIKVVGTPDEENAAGKFKLKVAGAFDDADIWLIAHPSSVNTIQPLGSRINISPHFVGKSHQEAVRKAYEAIVAVDKIATSLPGMRSSVTKIQNVGMYSTNVLQSQVNFGVSGSDMATVNRTVSDILDDTFPRVSFTTRQDPHGIAIKMHGPGGHASLTEKTPLDLSVATFEAFSNRSGVSFYVPGNTSATELDITFDVRSRYMVDLPAVVDAVRSAVGKLGSRVSMDLRYPNVEVPPFLPETWIDLVGRPAYNLSGWQITDQALADSDIAWVQGAHVDPQTHKLVGMEKVVFQPNYNICEPGSKSCPFNHEPGFLRLAGSEYSYTQTEIVARAQAQLAVQLLTDETMYNSATAILAKNRVIKE